MRVIIFFILFLLLICGGLYSGTFFVYVEEISRDKVLGTFSYVKEGLLEGLFDLNHVVFDDAKRTFGVDWDEKDFENLVEVAVLGGAVFVVAVKVTKTAVEKPEVRDETTRLERIAEYYYIEVDSKKLIGSGRLVYNDRDQDISVNEETIDFMAGEEISYQIESIWREYFVYNE